MPRSREGREDLPLPSVVQLTRKADMARTGRRRGAFIGCSPRVNRRALMIKSRGDRHDFPVRIVFPLSVAGEREDPGTNA